MNCSIGVRGQPNFAQRGKLPGEFVRVLRGQALDVDSLQAVAGHPAFKSLPLAGLNLIDLP